MHHYSLNFLNPEIEVHYQLQNLSNQTKLFSTFIVFQFSFLLFLGISAFIHDPGYIIHIMIFSFSALFLLIVWLIRYKWKKFYQLGLKIFFFGFGLILTEFSLLLKESDNNMFFSGALAYIIPIQSFCSLMLLVRLNWMLSSLIYLINLVYFIFRMVDIQKNWDDISLWVGLLLGVMNFASLAFREQSIFREFFKKNYDSYEGLNLFQLLLRNVLPSSIFILNYNKELTEIDFINTQALRLINKTLEEENFLRNSRYIDHSWQHTSLTKEKSLPSFKEHKEHEVDYEKIKEFFKKMDIMDQQFSNYQNNIPQILSDYFHSKIPLPLQISPKTQDSPKIIQFLSLNLSLTISNESDNIDEIKKPSLNPLSTENEDLLKEKEIEGNSESRVKYYELKVAKILWNDKMCLLILLSDMTKSKQIIELKNIDKHRNQLLATISHDLRTPLNGVIGMINATLNEIIGEKVKEFLMVALKSASLLDYLIKDILDFSQISYKKLRLNLEDFDIQIIIQEVFSLMKFQARTKPFALELESLIPEGLLCKSDSNRIKQILINLLSNAIKFTKQGFIRLKVELFDSQDIKRQRLKLSVQDTGLGIRKDDQGNLFKLFGKLPQSDPEINKYGIGLGLAISNNLAKLLDPLNEDAGLHVESIYGEGSTFWFFMDVGSCESLKKKLSFTKSDSSPRMNPNRKTDMGVPGFDLTKPLALIVDDDMINLFVLEKYLEYFKIEVIRAMNGIEALEVVERDVIQGDLRLAFILMDCNMPLMNGLDATEAILKALDNAKKERIPIIGISANDTQEEVEKCLKAGMMKFLVKPVKREEFCNLIEELIKDL